jgi:beta-phosphoglucomutase-like phosphatase (HAD superfamily)
MEVEVAITVREGHGILSGVHDSEAIERRIEEERSAAALAAQREAEQAATRAQIEVALSKGLREEIEAEMAERKISAKTLKQYRPDWLRFEAYCAKLGLDHLPASPQAVAAFLTSEIHLGQAHLRRYVKVITVAHRVANLDNPTNDILVRATLRLASEPSQTDKPSN